MYEARRQTEQLVSLIHNFGYWSNNLWLETANKILFIEDFTRSENKNPIAVYKKIIGYGNISEIFLHIYAKYFCIYMQNTFAYICKLFLHNLCTYANEYMHEYFAQP